MHLRSVLVVSKVRAGGHLYYLAPTGAVGGPAVEAPGTWMGGDALFEQRPGVVDEVELAALLDGRHPSTGAELGSDRRRVTVAGFDMTFCAPKSVSLLFALGDADVSWAVRVGHDQAVGGAMGYVHDHALAVRREVDGVGRVPLPVQAPPAAAFVHRTSRALDPHLHTHVVVVNVGRGPDGSWSALDGRGVYAHRAAASALYHAQLRQELTASLGVAWGPLEHGRAEIEGIGVEARRAFSRRSAEIAAHLTERGLSNDEARPSRRAMAVAALATRPPKDLHTPVGELGEWWRARARVVGLGPSRVEAVRDRVPARSLADDEVGWWDGARGAERAEEALAGALGTMRPWGVPFARRHLVRAWAETRSLGERAQQVEEQVDRLMRSAALERVDDGERRLLDAPGVGEPRHFFAGHLRQRHLGLERRWPEEKGRGQTPERAMGLEVC